MKFAMLAVASACVLVVGCGGSSQSDEASPDTAITLEQAERFEQAERTRWRQVDSTPPAIAVATKGAVDLAGSSSLAGTVTDDKAVYRVTWTNNRGGTGRAVLSGTATQATWSAAAIQLQTGDNTITLVAEDVAGNATTTTSVLNRGTTASAPAPAPAPAPSAAPSTESWTRIASESGSFNLTSTRNVRYGVTGKTVTRSLTGGTWMCNNETFGDPAPGNNKFCESSSGSATAPAPAPAPTAPTTTAAPAPATAPAPAPAPSLVPTVVDAATTFVNAALVPMRASGASNRRINNSGEMPYRDPDGMGAFRTVCEYSHMNFDDPLVYPGQVGRAHLHVFFGNTALTANSTPESIRTTGDSTCRGGIVNRTAYWAPAMIDTRDGRPIQPGRNHDIYYKTGYGLFGQNSQVVPFPQGFRMIANDSKSRVSQRKGFFECNGAQSATIPNCPNGELRQIIEFPQCWDGVNLDSPDHRSHVVYASNGSCPASHPVHFPEITMIIKYNVPSTGSSTWRLSSDINGTPSGSSSHADWVNGWEQDVLDTFVNRVIRQGLSGGSHIVGDGRTIYY